MSEAPLLLVQDLKKTFVAHRGWPIPKRTEVRALDGVSFEVGRGEVLGVVGESGCGKSTVARVALRLQPSDGGSVTFDGADVHMASRREMRAMRRRMQMIFQDPASSLDGRQRIIDALGEPLRVHGIARGAAVRPAVERLLDEVGLPRTALDRYPHEFSGGQRQRIGIARALSLSPDLIFADEPVSALDVSVQAQILMLLERLRRDRGLAFVFISHDLGVVRHFCDRVVVMYLGRVVESGPTAQVFAEPLHPYTRLLKESSPEPDPTRTITMNFQEGEPPSPVSPPTGCHFHPRCRLATERCRTERPALRDLSPGRTVSCHLA
ncbi:MAG: ABC transporter ATP-binding protein [Hyphomicrobiales bacterium]|nr:ABC transporter ATP-binding protein [Hyphomicrobiales bacterium]